MITHDQTLAGNIINYQDRPLKPLIVNITACWPQPVNPHTRQTKSFTKLANSTLHYKSWDCSVSITFSIFSAAVWRNEGDRLSSTAELQAGKVLVFNVNCQQEDSRIDCLFLWTQKNGLKPFSRILMNCSIEPLPSLSSTRLTLVGR